MRAMLLVLAFSVAATQGATPPPESAAELARHVGGVDGAAHRTLYGMDSGRH